jgi:hypothetical protein
VAGREREVALRGVAAAVVVVAAALVPSAAALALDLFSRGLGPEAASERACALLQKQPVAAPLLLLSCRAQEAVLAASVRGQARGWPEGGASPSWAGDEMSGEHPEAAAAAAAAAGAP